MRCWGVMPRLVGRLPLLFLALCAAQCRALVYPFDGTLEGEHANITTAQGHIWSKGDAPYGSHDPFFRAALQLTATPGSRETEATVSVILFPESDAGDVVAGWLGGWSV